MKFNYEDLILEIPSEVYEPREDSFLIAKEISKLDLSGKKVLEIGTGSGILSLIASKKAREVIAVDINEKALEAAKKNAKANKIENIQVMKSNLFENISKKFDLIIFNPPYVPSEEITEIKDKSWAGGKNGRDEIDRFLAHFSFYLKPKGKILLLQSSLSNIELTLNKLTGFKTEILASEKLAWEKIIVIEAQK